MGKTWIEGKQVPYEEAVAAAADAIGRSRLPLVTGLASDVAGVKAAIRLAQLAGGVVDHRETRAAFANLSVLRDSGMFLGAPAEIRRRADRFLVLGPQAFEASPDLPRFLFSPGRDLGVGGRDAGQREIVWLGAPPTLPALPNSVRVERVDCDAGRLAEAAAAVRAAIGGKRFGEAPIPAEKVAEIAGWLKAADFGCVLWSGTGHDELAVEMFSGLARDLNADTRFTCLPLHPAGHVHGAAQVATWTTGFPLRVGFGRGYPEHDPHLFGTGRLIASGEADLAVLLSALDGYEAGEPDWSGDVPVIALTAGDAWRNPPKVGFEIAVAGRDGDGVLYQETMGSFVAYEAGGRSGLPSAADALNAIAARLGEAALVARVA